MSKERDEYVMMALGLLRDIVAKKDVCREIGEGAADIIVLTWKCLQLQGMTRDEATQVIVAMAGRGK